MSLSARLAFGLVTTFLVLLITFHFLEPDLDPSWRFPQSGGAQVLEPISYNLRVPALDKHIAEVEAIFPTGGGASIEIMMAVWSPGFFRVEDYAKRV